MASRSDTQTGLTLVELLISMAILAMLMVSATTFYQFVSQNWDRTKGTVSQTEQSYHDWMLVSEALTSTIPKVVRREDEQIGFYFLGDQSGFTGFTSNSIQNPDYPAIYRFFAEQSNDERGERFQLVYEEAMLKDVVVTEVSQELPFNFRRVVWRDLSNVQFIYTGWENFTQRMALQNMNQGFEAVFDFPVYDGAIRRQHPLQIHVVIEGFKWTIDVPDTSNELISRSVEEG